MRYTGFPLKISPPPSERLYDAVRKGCVQMKNELHDADAGPFEKLLLDIARVHHWTGLYAPGHPILAGRIDALRGSLSGEARLNLSEATIRDIGLAALLHDIGKELVPAEILNKPEKLDPLEFAKISLHPVLGATHLRKISLGSDLPVIVCYEIPALDDGTEEGADTVRQGHGERSPKRDAQGADGTPRAAGVRRQAP